MDLVRTSIRQPVTVSVGVLLILLAGYLALQRIAIQLTPNVEDTVVAVTTRWEGASPQEVEQEVVDPQEERLQGITGLKRITSVSQQGSGSIRLEFDVGTPKELALREVSDKLREVPSYPVEVDEPVVEASDPDNRDYIAWIVFGCTDPSFDVRELQDWVEDRIKPVLERVPGVSEINVLGGRERETQVRFDPARLAQLGISIEELARALQGTNENTSAGALDEAGSDVRLRMVSQYESVRQVEETLVAETDGGPIYVRDVAEVVETFKEPTGFVRSRGETVIAINAQREVGANVMDVMQGLRDAIAVINAPGGVLDSLERNVGLDETGGELTLTQVYDQTIYIDDALALVRNNIWIGGGLAILVLLLFLRSVRTAGIIALSIPISVVGAVVFMVALGRSVNVISLAGMAFAVGMVVDNAIVVLENVFRHLEMGKPRMQAAYDGAREVFGAVVASTLTTVVVFVPILLIEEEAGQLFRDIALAIVASVTLSLAVSITVIPCAAARLLAEVRRGPERRRGLASRLGRPFAAFPGAVAGFVHALNGSVVARLAVVALMTAGALYGTWALLPPADYLPTGNRNLIFGIIQPAPGTSVPEQERLGLRVEDAMRPYFEAGKREPGSAERAAAEEALPAVPTFDFATMSPGPSVVPPPLENYFVVSFPGAMFHGGIAADGSRVADVLPLFQHATRSEVLPGVLAFAFQVPLFQLGGRSGSAVEINFSGDDLDQVQRAAGATYGTLVQRYGPFSIQPDPANFDLPTPELQVLPNLERLGEVGLTPAQLGLAVSALGDGAFLGDYVVGSQTVDLKLVADASFEDSPLSVLGDQPLATRRGVVPLAALADLRRVNAPGQINRTGRQRSVSLQFTPPQGLPLGEAMASVDGMLSDGRASGVIPPDVQTSFSGSASKLDAVQSAMLGDGTLGGTLGSSLVLALLVVYLLMCVLFQSFLRPLIILFSVPLATLGGFVALFAVHVWSKGDRYMPTQNLDVLTMLGFVILIGIVVNNAILIVHQSIQFMKGTGDEGELGQPLEPRRAITEAVRSRVRPIFMSTMTSVLGMSPLVLMPGAGSELYRGLGSVVVGGLLVSTVFTLLLVPLLLSLVSDVQDRLGWLPERRASEDATRPPVREGAAGAAGAAGTALALLLLPLLGLLGGCASREPSPTPLSRITTRLLREEVDRALATEPPPPAPAARGAEVAAALGDDPARRAELENLGGPGSYRDVELVLDSAGPPVGAREVTLEECVMLALKQNLRLERARLRAEADAEELGVQVGAFDSVLFSSVEGQSQRLPNRVPVIGGVQLGAPLNEQSLLLAEVGLARLLPGGATVSLSTFLQRLDNKTQGIAFAPDPAWSSGVSLGATQPLLRGRGSLVTEAGVTLAGIAARASEAAREAERLAVVSVAEQAWWDLAEAWSTLRIRRHLVDQGVEVERVLRARLEFDTSPSAYSDALATLQARRTRLVEAERVLRLASDVLRLATGDENLTDDTAGLLAPAPGAGGADPLGAETIDAVLEDDGTAEPGLRASIAAALDARPELEEALASIEDAELREELAADLQRPRLDLEASVALAGLDSNGTESYESLLQDDQLTALLGLTFEQPIGARSARAATRQAKLRSRESLAAFEQTLRAVLIEVKTAVRDVRTTRALLDNAHATRLAASENLRTILLEEESRERLTPEFLALKLTRQDRLGEAQLAEVRALAAHHRALAAHRRAIGSGPRDMGDAGDPTIDRR